MSNRLHMQYHPGINPPEFHTEIASIIDSGVILKESYCYPRGGGQPGDIGTINQVRFGEVKIVDGEIVHPIESIDDFSIGDLATVEINKARRNSLAEMHSAQHLVCALAGDMYDAETVGNQIDVETTRVDLFFQDKTVFNQIEFEEKVNETLRENIPINAHEWDREEVLNHDLIRLKSSASRSLERLPPSISTLRIIEIKDIDICPCAGTHVSNTNDIPAIKITKVKSKGAGKLRLAYSFVKSQ